ncbi:UDP-glucuronate:xylan alpha-glucuronosyltransferase 2-like isoform X2 [Nymphaea colorata]|uniref:UDP-glucuronate:xylan alpha-glucuronosyltransferase 2-like isoform X2 n=1 Tax=Nymphaea colorata TaxID=210225 RepID=UPI00129D27DB|nr:UDP-glucuronate:xylan alpha-glucuronosyltransferase 2-like isoform X2 [Nymphaea colorata]
MMKTLASKILTVKANMVLIAILLIVYAVLLLKPSFLFPLNGETFITCLSKRCQMKKMENKSQTAESSTGGITKPKAGHTKMKQLEGLMATRPRMKIALINLDDYEIHEWVDEGETTVVQFEKVPELLKWEDLFPEWVDEEEDDAVPSCPEIPMPDFGRYPRDFDMVVAGLPCKSPEEGWKRDAFRLQVHLISANFAVKNGRDDLQKLRFVFLSECMPMVELFKCEEMVMHEKSAWVYDSDLLRLEEKIHLPFGACRLALPLWKEAILFHRRANRNHGCWANELGTPNEVSDVWRMRKGINRTLPDQIRPPGTGRSRREAYVTVLHSSEQYVCGAITLAHTLHHTNTTRDLVILVDNTITPSTRLALRAAGWKIRDIRRIRNPYAQRGTYNEYNYSKLRLWQLADYDRVVFVDSDVLILGNVDLLFDFPELSATGDDGMIFNSGLMVIEPSACMFKMLMGETSRIVPYNGGDQGFLNEMFVWWHRLPRRLNCLKVRQTNHSMEMEIKNQLFGSDPPELYGIHFLGIKPWMCYRDYDCNWDTGNQIRFASDVAHRAWWKVHDALVGELQRPCLLTPRRKIELAWERRQARIAELANEHWRINVTDPRQFL